MSAAGTVTLVLTQGESPNPTATFSSAMAARQVCVGSGPDAHWKIRAQGVEPIHVELYWDGAALWVRDAGSLSGVYVGVERADDWQQVFDGSDVFFGQAAFRSKVIGAIAEVRTATAPTARAAFLDEEESTQVFSNQEMAAALEAYEPPRASPMPAPVSTPAPAPRQATMAPTWKAGPNGLPNLPSLPGAPGSLTGATQPVPPMGAPSSIPPASGPPSTPPAASKLLSSEATVIRPSPYLELEAAGLLNATGSSPPVAPTPLAGANGAPPPRLATMAPPVTANLPMAPGLAPMMAPPPAMAPPPLMAPPLMAPPPMGAPPGMLPPDAITAPAAPVEGDDPFGPMDIPPPAAKPGASSIPPRTWALAIITAVVGLGVTFIGPSPQQQQQAGPARPRQRVTTIGAAPPTSNNVLQLPIGEPGLVGVIVPAPMTAADAQGRARPLPPPNLQDPIRLAAEAVANNHFAEAAAQYEALAQAHPEAPLFRQFAVLLRAKAAANCQPGAPGCAPAQPSPQR
ncbi:MAG: hypothetical protein R3A52_09835 [Polyangiales bacterium]